MKREPKVILGITPGTRYLGVAILHSSELQDWRTKTFRGKWSSLKKKNILATIERMIEQYQVTDISLKKFHPSRTSKNLDKLIIEIEELSKSKALRIYHYTIEEIKKSLSKETRINKRRLSEMLAERNPELLTELIQEDKNRNSYYGRVLEAVAMAQICADRLKR